MNLIIVSFVVALCSFLIISRYFDFFTDISMNDHILINGISKYLYTINEKEDIQTSYKNYLNLLETYNNKYKSLILFDNFIALKNLAYKNSLTNDDIIRLTI
jgi:hypothetical protein